jgi:SAM-dependent methyltransferase
MNADNIRKAVRDKYASVVINRTSCCGPSSSCCGPTAGASAAIGYSAEDLKNIPDDADLGLGCGNPVALASLSEGETVLDLGSGAGIDCFLAAKKVGQGGRVIGVDMTPEMLERARENARKSGISNVEFRLGEIENLPVADSTADAAISNCVINLSPDKARVFREVYRVLKPGGRMMVSDIVLERELPEEIARSVAAYTGCIAGASLKSDYLGMIAAAGFDDVRVAGESALPLEAWSADPTATEFLKELGVSTAQAAEALAGVKSVRVHAIKRSRG